MTATVAGVDHLGSAGTNYLVGRLHQLAVFGVIDPDVWDQAVESATRYGRGRVIRHTCGDIGENPRPYEVVPDNAPVTVPTPAPTPAPEPVPA